MWRRCNTSIREHTRETRWCMIGLYAGVKEANNKYTSCPGWLQRRDTSQTVPNYCYTGSDRVLLRLSRFVNECKSVIMSVHIRTPLHMCVSKKEHHGCVYVHLTSLSLFSYLLAFLPWLFLLSFFRSDWDLSRESCFILCSIWYLLNVA